MQMSIRELIEKNIADGAEISWSGPVPDEKIHLAEQLLGVPFPESYKAFIREFGSIEIDGFPLSGLTQRDVGESGDVVAFTKHCRTEYKLPVQYIALNFQDGDYFLSIDTSKTDDLSESPIVLIDPVKKQRHGPVSAPSFGNYLVAYLSN
jgi:hypothetical protein